MTFDEKRLGNIEFLLRLINRKLNYAIGLEVHMASDLQGISDAVANATTVEQSAIEMIQGLADQIASLKNDPAALQALSDSLNAKSSDLAAKITENTPAAPTPTP